MSYLEKLKDPRWQRRRLEVLQRDDFKCRVCNNHQRQVQVHHYDYFYNKEPWEYPLDMLITLCDSCHDKERVRWKAELMLLNSLKMKGFLVGDLTRLSCAIDQKPDFVNHILLLIKKI